MYPNSEPNEIFLSKTNFYSQSKALSVGLTFSVDTLQLNYNNDILLFIHWFGNDFRISCNVVPRPGSNMAQPLFQSYSRFLSNLYEESSANSSIVQPSPQKTALGPCLAKFYCPCKEYPYQECR